MGMPLPLLFRENSKNMNANVGIPCNIEHVRNKRKRNNINSGIAILMIRIVSELYLLDI